MILHSGHSLGRYQIQERIGQGGMAVVYKALDPMLGREVAIKIIRTGAFPPDMLHRAFLRFEREAKVLAQLDHPNIVKVLDYGETDGAPYLVMEYLEGSTLKSIPKPMTVDAAVQLIRPIVDAFEYIHSQGLLHRDVKPSNIMQTTDGRVVLMDFGIAKWIESSEEESSLTMTGAGIGTPEYMAPEQGVGKKIDRHADEYALAVVFYELITGYKPFRGTTPVEILTKQVVAPFPDPRMFNPALTLAVKNFFDRALAKNPEDRYPSLEDFLSDLESLSQQSAAKNYESLVPVQPAASLSDLATLTTFIDERFLVASLPQPKTEVRRKYSLLRKLCLAAGAMLVGIFSTSGYHYLIRPKISFGNGLKAVPVAQLPSDLAEETKADQAVPASTDHDQIYQTAETAKLIETFQVWETAAAMRTVRSKGVLPYGSPATAVAPTVSETTVAILPTATSAPSPTPDAVCRAWLPDGEAGRLTSFYGSRLRTDDPMIPNRLLGSVAVIDPPAAAHEDEWVVQVVDYRQKWTGGDGVDEMRYPCSWINERIHCGPFDFYYSALTDNADYAYDSYASTVLVYPQGKDCCVFEANISYDQFLQARNAVIQLESARTAQAASDHPEWGDAADGNGGGGPSPASSSGVDYLTKPESEDFFSVDYLTKP